MYTINVNLTESVLVDVGNENYVVDVSTPTNIVTIEQSIVNYTTATTYPYIAITGSYTIATTDYLIHCTTGSFTVTLPSATGIQGKVFDVKSTSTGTITVRASGSQLIDGNNSGMLNQYDNLQIMSTNTNWIIL
jgi:hypothetical protein